MIGHTLDGRYVIRSRIARGGMAMVYLGNDLRLERRVAVKVMHAHLAEDDNFVRRFEQEARSAARLAHPNLVSVLDQGIDGGLPYLIMEYLPSITLRELLKQQRRLTTDQALEMSEAVLAGLAAAHDADIVHRDLKPENVLLADDGRIKIGDFGLARAVSANTTTGQALLGTIAYLSPELVTRGVADARSDLYAFGIMLFEMLTGQQPFQGEQAMQIAYQHAHGEVPAPSTVTPEVSADLDELVRWLTSREPSDRPANAGEVLPYVRRLRGGEPLGSTRVLPVTGVIGDAITPATTVLSRTDQAAIIASASQPGTTQLPASSPHSAHTAAARPATNRIRRVARRRTFRGRWLALLLIVAVPAVGAAGWWWGQGPGSQVTVPEVTGAKMSTAQFALEELDLIAVETECASLEIPVGHAVLTQPSAGARVDRGSEIRLCRSIGPEQLGVPTLVGLSESDAIAEIEAARFVFGEVLERRFDGGSIGTVILALDEQGDGLGDTYPEQARIDLIVSAGAVPSVAGLTVDAGTSVLVTVGLSVDPALYSEAHHEDIAAGSIISLNTSNSPLRVGDSVGLHVSLGPELFEVPSVAGMSLQDAMNNLAAHGFSPTTNVPEALRHLATATHTTPSAGEMLRAGATIQVVATITL